MPDAAPIRLAKRTSNLFRPRQATGSKGLDVSALGSVIDIDPDARIAQVQGMATYETIVDATLLHGLMPLVVPQLRTITLGGAVTGLGIESSSFRNGLPHESVLDLDVLTGDGEVITASRDQNPDLFRGFPNSYGSLGYSVRLRVELEPVKPFVRLRNMRFTSITAFVDAMAEAITGSYAGEPVDFVDGVAFERDDLVLVLGQKVAQAPQTSEYLSSPFYLSLREKAEDYLTIHDYLWRWDTDWFWCSKALGVQRPLVRRVVPNRYLRSETYGKLIRFENRHGWMTSLDARRGKPPRERVVQDVEVPLNRTADFLAWFLDTIDMRPIWLCPMAVREQGAGDVPWPLYPMRPGEPYVNVGFWGTVEIPEGGHDGDTNKLIERVVADHDGHKSLYSDAYYSRADFASMYGGEAYAELKQRYDPAGRLPDLYTKVVERR
ncbi:FAD-binding oxidoreductase [Calidifontibacter terrae]